MNRCTVQGLHAYITTVRVVYRVAKTKVTFRWWNNVMDRVLSIPELTRLIASFSDSNVDVARAFNGVSKATQFVVNHIKEYYQRHVDMFVQKDINEEERQHLYNFFLRELRRRKRINGVLSRTPSTVEFATTRLQAIFAGCHDSNNNVMDIAVAIFGEVFDCEFWQGEGDCVYRLTPQRPCFNTIILKACDYKVRAEMKALKHPDHDWRWMANTPNTYKCTLQCWNVTLECTFDKSFLQHLPKPPPEQLVEVELSIARLTEGLTVIERTVRDTYTSVPDGLAQYILDTKLVEPVTQAVTSPVTFINLRSAFLDLGAC